MGAARAHRYSGLTQAFFWEKQVPLVGVFARGAGWLGMGVGEGPPLPLRPGSRQMAAQQITARQMAARRICGSGEGCLGVGKAQVERSELV